MFEKRGVCYFSHPDWGGVMQFYHLGIGGVNIFFATPRRCLPPPSLRSVVNLWGGVRGVQPPRELRSKEEEVYFGGNYNSCLE